MMRINSIPQIAELSIAEKMQLMEELWDEVSREDSRVPIPISHKKELDKRLHQYNTDSDNLLSMKELQEKIRLRK